jgi:hypothetical protein
LQRMAAPFYCNHSAQSNCTSCTDEAISFAVINNVCFLAPEPLVQLRCSSKKSTHIKARHSDTEDVMEGKLPNLFGNLVRIKISKEKDRFPNDAEQLQKHARRIERDTRERACGALATAGRPTHTRCPFFFVGSICGGVCGCCHLDGF